jgi:uncharacterized membrane protein
MRRNLEIVGIAALAAMLFVALRALYGPTSLPQTIPTHFGIDGQPDGFGSRWSLLSLPTVALALYLLISVVARFPSAFNYPVRVTPANRPRLESLALDMITWLKVEVACVFAWLERITIVAARNEEGSLSPLFMPLALAAIFGTVIWYFLAMRRAARPASPASS